MQSQFFPASFCVAINGLANNSVQFTDLNVNNLVFANTKTWVNNSTGVNTPVYEMWFLDYNSLTYTTYYFPRTEGQTINQLLAILNSWAPANNFFEYTDWIQINRRPIGTAKPILLNDDYVRKRIYVTTDGGQTNLYVGGMNTLSYQIFTVSGDQTKAVTYYYDYSWTG